MTIQDIIKQTESFTIEQKQQLAYYFLFSTISEDKKQEFMNLFHYKDDFEEVKKEKNIEEILDKYIGKVKNVWNEDAQVYINKLREDDRDF